MDNDNNNGKTVFICIAAAACALGAVAFGLAFTRLGIYSLICSVLFELASLAFCNAQKKATSKRLNTLKLPPMYCSAFLPHSLSAGSFTFL